MGDLSTPQSDPLAIVDAALANLGLAIRIDHAVCHWAAWLVDTNCGKVARRLSGAPADLSAEQARLFIYALLAIELHDDQAIGAASPASRLH